MGNLFSGWFGDKQDISNAQEVLNNVDNVYEMVEPFALGTFNTEKNIQRTRMSIYTTWQNMLSDPTISASIGLNVSAALGGHESRGEILFLSPNKKLKENSKEYKIIMDEKEHLQRLLNSVVYSLCYQAVGYGDSYCRTFYEDGKGLVDLINNQMTMPYKVQAYEIGSDTVGYHILEDINAERRIAKLNATQMVRMKMHRGQYVPQTPLAYGFQKRWLETQLISDLPLIPAEIGGSFLFEAESSWQSMLTCLSGMTSQQIADSVKQTFLSVNIGAMPKEKQKKYYSAMQKMIDSYSKTIKDALSGGKSIFGSKVHVMPVYDDKQIVNPIGDITGQRSQPINDTTFMIHVRRLCGSLGIDMSLVGWADMLAGGLGDGAAFHTSAKIAQNSAFIREAVSDVLNNVTNLHLGYKYGDYYAKGDLPFTWEFYSDISASSTEQLNNKQTRANTVATVAQSLQALKEVGLDEDSNASLLADVGGFDIEDARKIASALAQAPQQDGGGGEEL